MVELTGHEWAKRQASQAGIGFTELSNGFATCADPKGLQGLARIMSTDCMNHACVTAGCPEGVTVRSPPSVRLSDLSDGYAPRQRHRAEVGACLFSNMRLSAP